MTRRAGVTPAAGAVVVVLAVLTVVLAVLVLADGHLDDAPGLLATSTVTAVVAVGGLAAQPWLARRARWHAVAGSLVVLLVAVHVGALVLLEPDDALFAVSPEGPTRARAALLGTLALVAVAVLGLLRRYVRWRRATFRFLHAGLGVLAVALGVAHATLTDGAIDGHGTVVLLTLGAVGLLGGLRGMLTRTTADGPSGSRNPRSRPGAPGRDRLREGIERAPGRG